MPLHPTVADALAHLPAPPPGPLDPARMRAAEEQEVVQLGDRLPIARVEDRRVGATPVRVYVRDAETSTRGILVYAHGGAFFLGSLETHDHIARELAQATGLSVVSVDYRRAPEHAFPAGLDDCWNVVTGIVEHGREELDWDGETLAVAGDSSGGTFAAAITARAHDEGVPVTHQVLMYPSLDLNFDEESYPSLIENAVGYGLETAGLAPFNAFYLDSGADPADPRVSPIKREDLTGLAPALVITAECDPLRDEGERYGDLLAGAGVPTTTRRFDGVGHGFIQHFGWIPEFHAAYGEITEFLS